MATPPFSIATTSPADSDVESAFPAVERTYRDVVNSWLGLISDSATGILKATAMPTPLMVSTDGGASYGPVLDIFRNSASPAAADFIGQLKFTGKDNAANTETYAFIGAQIDDPANASEDSRLIFNIMVGGTARDQLILTNQMLQYTLVDAGATADLGPMFRLYRDSSSPAADDVIGKVSFLGKNSIGSTIEYASFAGEIKVETNGAERGRYVTQVWDSGALRRCQTVTYGGNTLEPAGDLSYTINQAAGTNYLAIRGGNNGNGGVLFLYGEGHASAAGDWYLNSGGSTTIGYDASATTPLRVYDNAIFINNITKWGVDSGRVGLDNNSIGAYMNGAVGQLFLSAAGASLQCNATVDGSVIVIRGDTTSEGSISLSGTTVSYNAFMGSHWAELVGDKPLPWSIMETVDEPSRFTEADNLRLPKVQIAQDRATSKVYGVYGWEGVNRDGEEPEEEGKHYIPALGAGFIRIYADEVVHIGDLIEAGPEGCGIVQKGDIFAAGTVAKVTATYHVIDYPDGSYVVPATLHCG